MLKRDACNLLQGRHDRYLTQTFITHTQITSALFHTVVHPNLHHGRPERTREEQVANPKSIQSDLIREVTGSGRD